MNLILFDVSGTLVHSNDFEQQVLWRTLSKVLSIPYDRVGEFCREETESAFVSKVWSLLKGDKPTESDWEQVYQVYYHELIAAYLATPDRFSALDGAPELLSHLQSSKSWGFAIATSSWYDLAHLSLRGAGFYTRRFHVVSGESIMTKVDLINKAIESSKRWYGVQEFQKVTYVGDHNLNIAACQELKLPLMEVGEFSETVQSEKPLIKYPDKQKFIRLAKKAVVPTRIKAHSLISLMGLKS